MNKKTLIAVFIIISLLAVTGFVFRDRIFDGGNSNQGIMVFDDEKSKQMDPLEFLELLRKTPNRPVSIMMAPEGWISDKDALKLATYIGSDEPCSPVVSALSSYLPFNISTVGNETAFMLEGYLTGKYPPALHSENFERRSDRWYKEELEGYIKAAKRITTVYVADAAKLLAAIATDTEIILEPGDYLLDGLDEKASENKYARIDPEKGGLAIENVDNLTIRAEGGSARLLSGKPDSDVLVFRDSKNISLENIEAAHIPGTAGCSGSAAVFIDSAYISAKRCRFSGSGVVGLELLNVYDFRFVDSDITLCTYHILCVSNSDEIKFRNSRLNVNRGVSLINIYGSSVEFRGCDISGNEAVTDAGVLFSVDMGFSAYAEPFAETGRSSDIYIDGCYFSGNRTVSNKMIIVAKNDYTGISLGENQFEDNSFNP